MAKGIPVAFVEEIKLDASQFFSSLKRSEDAAVASGAKINKALDIKPGGGFDALTGGLKSVEGQSAKTSGTLSGLFDSFKKGQADAAAGGGVFGNLAGTLGQLASPAGIATAAIGALTAGLGATIAIGKEFETNLASVSAVTGLTGAGLDDIGNRAIDLSKKFGGDASTQLKAFQGVLSKFGADLAKTPEALGKVADNINVLAKAGGLDAAQSMDVLANSMLQFGVDVANPQEAVAESSRYINVLAASARVGAAEIPQVGAAVLVAGVAAKQAKVSFEETNAAIQVLAAGGKVGAEAGTALRNVLGKIAGEDVIPKEALAKLKSLGVDMNKVSNTSIPLSERLKELGKASKDATAFAQVFGTENAAAASILANGADTIKDWTAQVTGTNDANEQAAKNMATFGEAMSRLKANIEAVAINIYKAIAPALTFLANAVANLFSGNNDFAKPLIDGFKKLYEGIKPIADFIVRVVLGALQAGLNNLGTLWRTVFDAIGSFVSRLGSIVQPLGKELSELFGSFGDGASTMGIITDAFGVLADIIGGVLKVALGVIAKIFEGVIATIRTYIQIVVSAGRWVADTANKVYEWATSFEFVRGAIDVTVKFIRGLIDTVVGAYDSVVKFLGLADEEKKDAETITAATQSATQATQKNTEATTENAAAKTDSAKATKDAAKAQKELDEAFRRTLSTQQDLIADTVKLTGVARAYKTIVTEGRVFVSEAELKADALQEERQGILLNIKAITEYAKVANAASTIKLFENTDKLKQEDILAINELKLDIGAKISEDEKKKLTEEFQDLLTKLVENRTAQVKAGIDLDKEEAKKTEKSVEALTKNIKSRIEIDTVLTNPYAIQSAKSELRQLNDLVTNLKNKAKLESSDAKIEYEKQASDIEKKAKELEANITKAAEEAAQKRRETEILLIEDVAQRELSEKILRLEKEREKELDNVLLTESNKAAIRTRYEKQIAELRAKLLNTQAVSEIKVLNGLLLSLGLGVKPEDIPFFDTLDTIVSSVVSSFSNINIGLGEELPPAEQLRKKLEEQKKLRTDLPKLVEEAKKKEEELNQSVANGTLSYADASDKLVKATEDRINLEKQLEENKVTFLTSLYDSFYTQLANLSEQQAKKTSDAITAAVKASEDAGEKFSLFGALSTRSKAQEEFAAKSKDIDAKVLDAQAELFNAQLELSSGAASDLFAIDAEAARKRVADAEKNLAALQATQANYASEIGNATAADIAASEARSKAFDALAVNAGQQMATLLASSKNIGDATKAIAFDVAQSLVNIYAPSIIALFSSIIPPPFGQIAGGIAVAGLKALLQSLKNEFYTGGYTGDGGKYEVAGTVHRGEIVMEKGITQGNKNELLAIRKLLQGGVSAKEILGAYKDRFTFEYDYLPSLLRSNGISLPAPQLSYTAPLVPVAYLNIENRIDITNAELRAMRSELQAIRSGVTRDEFGMQRVMLDVQQPTPGQLFKVNVKQRARKVSKK